MTAHAEVAPTQHGIAVVAERGAKAGFECRECGRVRHTQARAVGVGAAELLNAVEILMQCCTMKRCCGKVSI
jgi:uncharacterized protein YdhG (YjbR/CyaY superfamily)